MIRHEAGTVAAARVGFCLGVAAVIWVDSLVAVAWRFRLCTNRVLVVVHFKPHGGPKFPVVKCTGTSVIDK